MKRFLKWSGIVLVGLVAALALFIAARQHRHFDAPEPPLHATTDSAMIARGRYLAFGPAHCAACHGPADVLAHLADNMELVKQAIEKEPPLSGGFGYPLPFGTMFFPNITPDSETGIGRYTDGQIARLLRYGVKPNGEALLPAMEYQNISDEDIVAILSFLRSQPPVRNPVPPHRFNLLGEVLKAVVFKPMGPRAAPPSKAPPEQPTIELGEYLANRVAQCFQCHTKRNMKDLSAVGPRFAGGAVLNEPFAPNVTFVTPNLTPDSETGRIATWTEDQFVQRFRTGRLVEHSPMPWEFFGHMSDTDLRAIYRYLMSLPPVHNETGASVRPREARP